MKFVNFSLVFITVTLNFSLAFECGLEGSASRIYKGTKVQAHKYPWLAQIRTFKDRNAGRFSKCGGSLIDESHIITAAHCVFHDGKPDPIENIDVFLGKKRANTEYGKALAVASVKIDKKYSEIDLDSDFAILTLEKPVQFTSAVSPICLPQSENGLDKLIVSGWGKTSAEGKGSDDLLEVDVEYVTPDECKKILKAYYKKKGKGSFWSKIKYTFVPKSILPSHMCAINKETKGDACSGDSGGPLMHKNSNGQWVLVGVVSGSWTECGTTEETAGLYTRTRIYKQFIQSDAPNAVWVDL